MPHLDHEIAKRVRAALGLEPPASDEIIYLGVDPPSSYAHPLCPNTYRDGKHIGEEAFTPSEQALAK
jgi:hypothetical protein